MSGPLPPAHRLRRAATPSALMVEVPLPDLPGDDPPGPGSGEQQLQEQLEEEEQPDEQPEEPFEDILFGPFAVCYSPAERHMAAWRCWQALTELTGRHERLVTAVDRALARAAADPTVPGGALVDELLRTRYDAARYPQQELEAQ